MVHKPNPKQHAPHSFPSYKSHNTSTRWDRLVPISVGTPLQPVHRYTGCLLAVPPQEANRAMLDRGSDQWALEPVMGYMGTSQWHHEEYPNPTDAMRIRSYSLITTRTTQIWVCSDFTEDTIISSLVSIKYSLNFWAIRSIYSTQSSLPAPHLLA